MRKSLLTALSLCFLVTSAAGCAYDYRSGHNYGSSKGREAADGPRAYGAQFPGDGPITHTITQLRLDQKLSDEVSALPGVNTAYVMVTDYNAYVALMLDNSAAGTRGGGAGKEVNNSGTSLGHYNPHNFSQGLDGNDLTSGFNSYDTVDNHDDLSHGLKQTVAKKIRSIAPGVHDVFISGNRDFLNLNNRYAQEAWKGNTLQPYVPEYQAAINKYFGSFESGSNPDESRRP